LRIDLVSLQDVVFVCCIFMILTLSYTHENTFDVEMPNPDTYLWCCNGCTSLVINVDRNNGLWIGDRFIDVRELPALLSAAKHNGSANIGIMIRAENTSSVSTYTNIVDVARDSGFENIQLVAYQGETYNKAKH